MNPELEGLVVGEALRDRARTDRTGTFVRFTEGDLSFGEVDDIANRLVRGLAELGGAPGAHVAIMLGNGPDIVHTIFAVAKLGAVAVPINTEYHGEMLRHVLATSQAGILVVAEEYLDRVAAVVEQLPALREIVVCGARTAPAPLGARRTTRWESLLLHDNTEPGIEVAFSDPQAIMYTSGTTGPCKGALCSHALAMACARDSLDYLDRWGKTVYCPLPLFHAAGLWDGLLSSLIGGGPLAVVQRFSASRFWDEVRSFDAQVCLSVFSMIPILLKREPSPDDRDHPLEMFYMGKSVYDRPLRERFGVRSVETYTSTEVGIALGSPYGRWREGSCGTANDARFEVAVVDEQDRVLGPGVPGEVVVRPKQPHVLTSGYYGAEEATVECFRNMWFHTGDRMWRDEDGYFYFVDRMKDAIRRRGETISAFDLECAVNQHPEVVECAAIGVPCELEDEEITLVVVSRRGSALCAAEIQEFCAARLPRFMVPAQVEFIDSLPRTPTDKVAKYLLRERFAGKPAVTALSGEVDAVFAAGPALAAPGAERA